jgi:hypothetical protein
MDGVRFTCQPGCVRCCEQKGFVYITAGDLLRLAQFLQMSPRDFEQQFVYRTRKQLRLRKPRGRQCHFLIGGGCQVHEVKPVQCRLFPFWPDLLESAREWNRTAKWCPGIGHGDLIQIGTALETASEMKQAYPEHY